MEKFFTDGPAEDPLYAMVRDDGDVDGLTERIEDMWARYAPYCPDTHFLREARSSFLQRTWEMYLGFVLLEHSLPLRKPPPCGPDLCIGRTPNIWIEAIAPLPGNGPDAVLPRSRRGYSRQGPSGNCIWHGSPPSEESVMKRITAAIKEKAEKGTEYVKKAIMAEEEPFVVALGLGGIEDADLVGPRCEIPLVAKSMLGLGPLTLSVPIDSDAPRTASHPMRSEITKRSGAKISTQGFLDGRFCGVSAIIWSTRSILKAPTSPGADLAVLHNPGAVAPLPRSLLPLGIEYYVEGGNLVPNRRRSR